MMKFPFNRNKNNGKSNVSPPSATEKPEPSTPAFGAEPHRAPFRSALSEMPAFDPSADFDSSIAPNLDEQVRMVEAMLFASAKPMSTVELSGRMPLGCDAAVAVRRLEEMYVTRGVQLVRIAGKWAFRTAPDMAHLLTSEVVEKRRLSKAAIETLAIIAYHQPVTRAEIEEIRQVSVSKGTVDLLMEIGWIKLGRRRQTPGRPVTFITSDDFLDYFGLDNLKDLPRLEELRQAGLFEPRPPIGFEPSQHALDLSEEDADEALQDDVDANRRDNELFL
jgi:segregation and condensation protein B